VINEIAQLKTIKFTGNTSYPDHFIILNKDADNTEWILLGGRNMVYNLSMFDFTELNRLEWPSSEAHSQLCNLKGRTEDDCQNYIRILVETEPGTYFVCGTNSYKPYCRHYLYSNSKFALKKEEDGIGLCPYNPDHNSTSVYYNGQLYSATVADFSGGDPLIYRKPQRTELSDLKQLNAPNFVSSLPYGDYIFFFFRETAVEYINCGKVIYSRVARVCKDDKGGPHQFGARWTSFLKARLNCSIPGEYPFYFDEIQSMSEIVDGKYNTNGGEISNVIYGAFTTPSNAIGGSAICVYNMKDIIESFEGSFKYQEGLNGNWLPVPKEKLPNPRPGKCVNDSRILPENNVNFVKTHSLMESAVPAMFGKPILIRVSIQYRFTSIAVQPQVKTIDDETFDVIYVGTDNGKVLKLVNIPDNNGTAKAVVISENVILPNGQSVKQLKIAPGAGSVIVVGRDEVRLATLNHCNNMHSCRECVQLQDPHCAWNTKLETCISLDVNTSLRRLLIQDVIRGDDSKCRSSSSSPSQPPNETKKTPKVIQDIDNDIIPTLDNGNTISGEDDASVRDLDDCDNSIDNIKCAVKQERMRIYTAETFQLFVLLSAVVGLLIGFVVGYFLSRKLHPPSQYADTPFIEQHNHLERTSTQSNFLSPRPNKLVNQTTPVVNPIPSPKKDNIDPKDLNIASDGTLQKIKKTYI